MRSIITASLLFWVALATPAQAQTYYVDATYGNDTWSGILPDAQGTDGPWKTTKKVNGVTFVAGDQVLFRCGEVWRERLTISGSGSSTNPVTYSSYGTDCSTSNKPAINAADVISGWNVYSGNIYSVYVLLPVTQVFVDGQYVRPAHHPNQGYLSTKPNSVFLNIAANSAASSSYGDMPGQNFLIAGSDLNLSSGQDIVGANIHIRTVDWRVEDRAVTSYDAATHTIGWQANTDFSILKDWGYYLDNKLWMLDEPGEWYWDVKTRLLYLWLPGLPDGSDPSNHVIEGTIRAYGINASSKSGIVVDGLKIKNAGKYAVYFTAPGDFILRNLDITNSGDSGIEVDSGGVPNTDVIRRIENSKISNSARQGIRLLDTPYVAITNNSVTDSGTVGLPVNSFAAINAAGQSDYMQATNNTVTRSGYNGINYGKNSRVHNNIVEESCLVLNDCGAIYTFNGATKEYFLNGSQIKNIPATSSYVVGNIVNGVRGGIDGTPRTSAYNPGIYLDNFSNDVEVNGNTVINAGVGLHANNPFDNRIHDNTIYGTSKALMDMVENYGAPFGTVQGLVNGNTTPKPNKILNNILFPTSNVPSLSLFNIPASPVADYFGDFDNNIYSALYGDKFAREAYSKRYYDPSPPNYYRDYTYYSSFTLPEWRAQRNQDMNSNTAPLFSVAPFKINAAEQGLINLTFDSDISTYRTLPVGNITSFVYWHPQSDCSGSTSGGCMEFIPYENSDTSVVPTNSHLDAGDGASFNVQKGATYLVQFKLKSKLAQQNLAVRIIGSSWTDVGFNNVENLIGLSSGQVIIAGQEWRDYTYVFTASEDTVAKVNFWTRLVPGLGPSILIDNLSVRKVSAEFNDSRDDTNIIVNNTSVAKVIACPDITANDPYPARCEQYVDLNGTPVNWGEPLAPFTSKIIVWANNPFKDSDHDGSSDSVDNCPMVSNTDQADSNGNGIGDACEADLLVTIIGSPDNVNVGGTVNYTVTVTNNGPSSATGVSVSGLTGCTFSSTTLASGTNTSCTSSVTANTAGTLTQTVTVSGTTIDPNATNNTASAATNVQAVLSASVSGTGGGTIISSPVGIDCGTTCSAGFDAGASVALTASPDASSAFISWSGCDTTTGSSCTATMSGSRSVTAIFNKSADLSVSLSATPSPDFAGQSLSYTATVTNNGPSDATGVVVTDALPSGVNLNSVSPPICTGTGTLTCSIGNLLKGGSSSITITVTPMISGVITSTASVSGYEADPNSANNVASAIVTIDPAADLTISLTDSPDPVALGQAVTYTTTVTNLGPSPTSGVNATGTLPACNIGTLPSGASQNCTATVTASTMTLLTQTMSVGGIDFDPNALNNTTSASTTVVAPDLISSALAVTTSGTNLLINDQVINQGSGAGGAFTVSYYFSTDAVYQAGDTLLCSRSVSGLAAGTSSPSTGTTQTSCPIPSVPANSYYVLAMVDSGNIVTESNEGNNTVSAGVTIGGRDLLPTVMTAARVSGSATRVTINDTVKNQGSQSAGGFTIRYYLSTNTTYEAGTDIPLATAANGSTACNRTRNSLNAGASHASTGKICYIPAGAVNGVNYYVLVVDDWGTTFPGGSVVEYNETNNVMVGGTVQW